MKISKIKIADADAGCEIHFHRSENSFDETIIVQSHDPVSQRMKSAIATATGEMSAVLGLHISTLCDFRQLSIKESSNEVFRFVATGMIDLAPQGYDSGVAVNLPPLKAPGETDEPGQGKIASAELADACKIMVEEARTIIENLPEQKSMI